jgi:transcriptional regulator GlxA family with amidase domain
VYARRCRTLATSVCTGALVFGEAGCSQTGRRRALVRARVARRLRRKVDDEARFIDDGDVVTAAGVSAGIDMALHLIARLESVERAQSIRRYIQYDPAPPV